MSDQAAATCTLTPGGAVVDVPVQDVRRVVYTFDTSATRADLALPYAVAIDGQCGPQYAEHAQVVRGHPKKITVMAPAGSTVALCLNSDAHPRHRQQPVYAVRVDAHDVRVNIKEVTGRNISHLRPVVGEPRWCAARESGQRERVYDAALTGDIWLAISHNYTADEADAMLASTLTPDVKAAVLRIYAGLSEPCLRVEAGDAALTVRLLAEMQSNARANTTHCNWLSDIVTRTHPFAFAALIQEALAAGVTEVRVVSAWRPCLGSIGHRAGLGLDINYIESHRHAIRVNRAALTSARPLPDASVTEKERGLYSRFLGAKKALDMVLRAKKGEHGADGTKRREAELDAARASKEWEEEMLANQPHLMSSFREHLGTSELVTQILDPWYVDMNTHDRIAPKVNTQLSPDEKLHNNHLHLTIREPGIFQ